ncbi:MAG: hypothetical protein GX801_09875 [Fibrobacter sp.]|nr:hypothetical protein [Fibrobacter sp.]
MNNFSQKIALELVPNSFETLLDEAQISQKVTQKVQCINIPEMMSKEIKAHHAADLFLKNGFDAIPHFRTRERTIDELAELISPLIALGLNKVLLITGDPPKDNPNEAAKLTPVQAIPQLKERFPQLKIYVGLDPYRQSFITEFKYCQEKLAAGADGFFSQPFFSPHLLSLWLEQLHNTEFWVGLSPVTTPSFKKYWENTNHVVFPPEFSIDLKENCLEQQKLMKLAAEAGQHIYLMPITVTVEEYLKQLL